MPIPDYESCMLPVLRLAADGQEHSLKETIDVLAKQFSLTEEELNEYILSGQQTVFSNRVSWARTYLKKAGLLVSPRRGAFKITQRGLEVLMGSVRQTSHALCGSVRETLILLYVVPSDESTGVRAGGHAGGQSIKHHTRPGVSP
jgi:restriction endonuclease Mrr